MISAEEHTSFGFGHKRLKNLKELLEVLKNPEFDHIAKRHVTPHKNDYANWIKDVLKEDVLAEKISKEKDINEIAKLIKEHLANEMPNGDPDEMIKKNDNVSEVNSADIMPKLETKEYDESKKNIDDNKGDIHLKKELPDHKKIIENVKEPRHFCPHFFHCMKKEFFFGFGLGIIVGIVVAIFIKIGAI